MQPESEPTTTPRDSLPPVEPPSGKFILQLFLVPGLIVFSVVVFLLVMRWLFGGPQSPDEFLSNLFDLDPDGIVELLRDQAAALKKPPRTFDDVVGTLAKIYGWSGPWFRGSPAR